MSSSREDLVLVWWMNTPPALCQSAFKEILAENAFGKRQIYNLEARLAVEQPVTDVEIE